MRLIYKILTALASSLLLISALGYFAFTGAFAEIETQYFSQRVIEGQKDHQAENSRIVKKYHDSNIERITNILNLDYLKNVYDPSQARKDIVDRTNLFGRLSDELGGFQYIRIIDSNQLNILYSTHEEDIKQRDTDRILFKLWKDSNDFAAPIRYMESKDSEPYYVYDPQNHRILYSFPAVDQYALFKGTVVMEFSISGLQDYLYRQGGISDVNRVQIQDLDVLIYNLTIDQFELLKPNIARFRSLAGKSDFIQKVADGEGSDYYLVQIADESGSISIAVIPGQSLVLNNEYRALLLLSIFITLFLIVFLLLNIKQNQELILKKKIKKFQMTFLRDLLEAEDELNWERYEVELKSRKDEVRREILKSLSDKFKKNKQDEIDALLDKSWDEIIRVLVSKKDEQKEEPSFTVSRT